MTELSVSGKLPNGDRAAGLLAQLAELLDDPKKVRVGIVFYDVASIKTTPETGDRVPTVRLRAFEPITPNDDADEMRNLLVRSVARRTGQEVLPLDLERELKSIFSSGESDDGPGEG